MKIQVSLDEIDVEILTTLERVGTKISTRELGKKIDIPSRTIRYRLNRLKEKGFLYPPKVQTHERKLGLGEYILLIRNAPGSEETLTRIFDTIPSIYLYGLTYGRFEGYILYISYPLSTPTMVPDLVEEFKKQSLVEEYYLIDVVDYQRRGAQISRILSDVDWNWNTWSKDISIIMKKNKELPLEMEEYPQIVNFDFKDVKILAHKVENPKITLRELGELLNLSQPQVHNRMKKLEESGIIRGYKPSIRPFQSSMKIGIFLRSAKNARKILQAFYQLPYFINIVMESSTHFFVTLDLPSSQINRFLEGYRELKPYADEMFLQFLIKYTNKGFQQIIETFNHETQSWKHSVDEYIKTIEDLAKNWKK